MFSRKKSKRLQLTPTEALFLCLEPNAAFYHGDQTFWQELYKVCKELTPGCICVEKFTGKPMVDLRNGISTSKAFHPDEQTVVIKLQNKETSIEQRKEIAIEAVELLNELFKSTGTHFVHEMAPGGTAPQIRSNIDKKQASKLSVISNFYFDREIKDPQQRKKIHEDCQHIIDAYTEGTDAEGWWKAREGVLPFVSLMGLHGNLRPQEKHKFSKWRKEAEINEHNPYGDPRLFKDVVVHVEMNSDGRIYSVLYDPARDAYQQAQGGITFRHFLFELFGGDVTGEATIAMKALRATGLVLGVKELLEGNPNFLIIGSVAGLCFGIDLAVRRRKIAHRLVTVQEQLEKKHELALAKEHALHAPAPAQTMEEQAAPKPNHDRLHHAYTRGHHSMEDRDGEDNRAVEFLKRIIENGTKDPDESHLEAFAAQQLRARHRS